jgi:8-oxo-dGTP pyrophosphatase MutT (NUDIX family)
MNAQETPELKSQTKPHNPEGLREIDRIIASALIFSSDGYLLMGRKNPYKGGVYPNAWHIPGGGIEDGESLEQSAAREIYEEVGLQISPEQLTKIPIEGGGSTTKTLESGERVWFKMQFNRFEARLDKTAEELAHEVRPGDDLVELRWFAQNELADVEQIPGGKEFFIQAGYIPATAE